MTLPPKDPFVTSAVVTFVKTFETGPKAYTYAAIKTEAGWFLTGKPFGPLAWSEFREFLEEGVSEVWAATAWAPAT